MAAKYTFAGVEERSGIRDAQAVAQISMTQVASVRVIARVVAITARLFLPGKDAPNAVTKGSRNAGAGGST